jgi:chemotaxis protein CheC
MNMKFDPADLKTAADIGSKKVAEAFTRLAGSPVMVTVSKIDTVPIKEALVRINPPQGQVIVVYAQLLSGVKGTSLLTLERESALKLVDLLNQQPVGTTGILKDIDRSAIKETLNILSNSYMNALAKEAGIELGLAVPRMITSGRLTDVVGEMMTRDLSTEDDQVVIFETTLTITAYKIDTKLFILFNEDFSGKINESVDPNV